MTSRSQCHPLEIVTEERARHDKNTGNVLDAVADLQIVPLIKVEENFTIKTEGTRKRKRHTVKRKRHSLNESYDDPPKCKISKSIFEHSFEEDADWETDEEDGEIIEDNTAHQDSRDEMELLLADDIQVLKRQVEWLVERHIAYEKFGVFQQYGSAFQTFLNNSREKLLKIAKITFKDLPESNDKNADKNADGSSSSSKHETLSSDAKLIQNMRKTYGKTKSNDKLTCHICDQEMGAFRLWAHMILHTDLIHICPSCKTTSKNKKKIRQCLIRNHNLPESQVGNVILPFYLKTTGDILRRVPKAEVITIIDQMLEDCANIANYDQERMTTLSKDQSSKEIPRNENQNLPKTPKNKITPETDSSQSKPANAPANLPTTTAFGDRSMIPPLFKPIYNHQTTFTSRPQQTSSNFNTGFTNNGLFYSYKPTFSSIQQTQAIGGFVNSFRPPAPQVFNFRGNGNDNSSYKDNRNFNPYNPSSFNNPVQRGNLPNHLIGCRDNNWNNGNDKNPSNNFNNWRDGNNRPAYNQNTNPNNQTNTINPNKNKYKKKRY